MGGGNWTEILFVEGGSQDIQLICWNMRISYCIHASIVEPTMLGRRASELALRRLWESGYGQPQ